MRRSRLLALLLVACATPLAAPAPAAATDPSGGDMAPADATVEPYTGGSAAPQDPAPASVIPRSQAPATPSVVAAAPTAPSGSQRVAAPAVPRARGTAKTSEPPAGGKPPANSPRLEPLPPSSQKSKSKISTAHSAPALAMTGGEMAMTLTLGLAFLAAGLAAAALGRRRRVLS